MMMMMMMILQSSNLIESNLVISQSMALSGAHVPPTKVFPRLAVNKTILKPGVAAATGAQYFYVGFSRRNKIPRCSTICVSTDVGTWT